MVYNIKNGEYSIIGMNDDFMLVENNDKRDLKLLIGYKYDGEVAKSSHTLWFGINDARKDLFEQMQKYEDENPQATKANLSSIVFDNYHRIPKVVRHMIVDSYYAQKAVC